MKIEGIHCSHCKTVIKNALLRKNEVCDVQIKNNIAHVYYEGQVNTGELIAAVTALNYFTKQEYVSKDLRSLRETVKIREFFIILGGIIVAAGLLQKLFGFNILNVIPEIDSSITYGMLVVTGLLTSIHCVGMCGAMNLTAAVNHNQKNRFKNPLLYNIGRVLAYTVTGGIVGLIGEAVSMNHVFSGAVIIAAAVIMLFMALRMLGIVDFSFPRFMQIHSKSRSSFVIGLLNGLMPCGPLQAMQIYALSTGSAWTGAFSMFLFGLGTVPLMLAMGIAVNFAKGKRRILMNKIASVLILVLSVVMLNRGLLTLNIDLFSTAGTYAEYTPSVLYADYQVVTIELSYDSYGDIVVQKGIPVKLIIQTDQDYLTGCNNEVVLRDFNIRQQLSVGENVIEFTPEHAGTYTYTCWMSMIKNYIQVIDDQTYFQKG